MSQSIFGHILTRLIDRLPDARSAVFADREGETVDYATKVGSMRTKLEGAHWGVCFYLFHTAFARMRWDAPEQLLLSFRNERIVIQRVTDDYYLLVASEPAAHLGKTFQVLERTKKDILRHM